MGRTRKAAQAKGGKVVTGWKTRDLSLDQVIVLRKIQRDLRLSAASLAGMIGVPNRTFTRALLGHRIWEVDADKIMQWLKARETALAIEQSFREGA